VPPLAALRALEGAGAVDVLILDAAYADAPVSLGRLCRMVAPRLLYFCDDGYMNPTAARAATDAPVYLASETGELTVKLLARE
jgi:hypothetical protein